LEQLLSIHPEITTIIATGYFIGDATRWRLQRNVARFLRNYLDMRRLFHPAYMKQNAT